MEKLAELNSNVKVEVIADENTLMGAIASGGVQVVCQTELLLAEKFLDPNEINKACRAVGAGYIAS